MAPLTEQVRWAALFPRAVTLNGLCRLALITHDVAALREYTASLASIGQEAGSLYALLAEYYQSFLRPLGDPAEAVIERMRTILKEVSALNYLFSGPYYRFMLAKTLKRAKQIGAALSALNDGLALSASVLIQKSLAF